MIVFDLLCDQAHAFEGWFGSSADFDSQQARGLLSCPLCDSAVVTKAPMAPAVPAKSNRADQATPQAVGPASNEAAAALVALARAQAEALSQSEWVGDRFASEVRAMHYGEREEKRVHGRATRSDALSLIEEGIAVAPLLVPVHPPEELN